MSNRYSGYPAEIFFGASLINLRQLESYSYAPNGQKSYLRPGGSLDRISAVLHSGRPVHSFTTRDIFTILTNASVGSITPSNGATWNWQQRACSGSFEALASTVHIDTVSSGGVIRPVSITCSESDTNGAIMSLEYYSLSTNGINSPDAKALAALDGAPTPTFISQYFMGPTRHNGADVPGVDQVTINFGLNVNAKLFHNVFPTCVTMDTRDPSITLTGTNIAVDRAISRFINATTGTGFVQYFRRGSNNNARVADATASHLSVALSAGCWSLDNESWQEAGDGQISVTVMAIGGALAINLATAIPAPS